MQRRCTSSWVLVCAAFLATAFQARSAEARTCASSSDCPRGYDCVGATGGGDGTCLSLSCQTDADCGPGFRCDLNLPATTCVTGPDGGQQCSSVGCAPQWDAPCTADADCGPGFTCTGTAGYDRFNCGASPDWDAGAPPYATVASVACPMPPGPVLFSPCDGGPMSCVSITWKTCVAQPTAPCAVDSDCPSTWTCQCAVSCASFNGGHPFLPDGAPAPGDAACTNACTPPNSDLVPGPFCAGTAGGFGGAEGGADSSGPTPAPTPAPAPSTAIDAGADSGAARSSEGSSGSPGGCQVGGSDAATGWIAGIVAAFTFASRRRRLRR